MTPRLVVRPQAESEMLAARDWYDQQRTGLGQEFVSEVGSAIAAAVARLQSFPRVHGEIRRAMLRRFPYGVFFRVAGDAIVILGIIHGRRHPRRGHLGAEA